jgi:hypothetical protein
MDGGGGRIDGGMSAGDTMSSTDTARAGAEAGGVTFDLPAAPRDAAVDLPAAVQDVRGDAPGVDRDVAGRDVLPGTPDVAMAPDVAVRDSAADGKDTSGGATGNPIVDRMAAAAAACGPQSRLTVPAGWQMVLAGEKGCAFYAPPTWQTIGAGTPTTFAVEDATRVTGSAVMAGVDSTGTATCTPHGVASWMFANNKDCVGFKELYWKDGVDVVAGIQIPRGDMVYSCTQSGVPIAGYVVVQIHGTWPLCNLLAFAFWMPETQIEARTCTLTQTLNSIQCPQGGGGSCSDATCRQGCVADGYQSGACNASDQCVCSR